jgi:putative salt-induced outer membrane protein YdiY
MRTIACVAGLSALWLAAAGIRADVVVMNDGSRIIGKVHRMQDGKLKLETEFAGTLDIDASKVASVETDESVNVEMSTGDKLIGKIDWKPDLKKGVVQTELGGVPFSIEKLQAIWLQGAKSPDELKFELKLAKAEEEYQAKLPKWAAELEGGIVAQEGNTDKTNARGKFKISRKTDKDLLTFYLSGEYEEANDVRNTSEAIGGARYEYLLTKRIFAYIRSEFEYDEFENLDLRATVVLGGGYYWLKKEDHEYKTQFGIGYRHEAYTRGRTKDEAILEAGHDYRLDIAPWMQFVHTLLYTPAMEDTRDYLLMADQGVVIPLASSKIWKIKLGAKYEYNSMPDIGVQDRLDETYYANLVAEFK